MGKSLRTSATSDVFSLMCVWMGRLVSLARAPRSERRGEVHEGANRGVIIGVMRLCVGSMESMWAIVAFVSSIACAGDSSRRYSGLRSESMQTRPMKALCPFWRQTSASILVGVTCFVAK